MPKENKLWKSLSVPKSLKRDEKPRRTNQEKAWLCPSATKRAKIQREQIKRKPPRAQTERRRAKITIGQIKSESESTSISLFIVYLNIIAAVCCAKCLAKRHTEMAIENGHKADHEQT